jgi:hypothetical protein
MSKLIKTLKILAATLSVLASVATICNALTVPPPAPVTLHLNIQKCR